MGSRCASSGCGFIRPAPLAQNFAGWFQLDGETQLVTAEARSSNHGLWTASASGSNCHPKPPDAQVFGAVASRITKVCELERRPDLLLAQVVRDLYASG